MARDDYIDYCNRGQHRGPDTFNDRERRQGGQWHHPQGQQGFQAYQGGYGQSGYGGEGYQGGYCQGWHGYGQQWGGGLSGPTTRFASGTGPAKRSPTRLPARARIGRPPATASRVSSGRGPAVRRPPHILDVNGTRRGNHGTR